MTILDKSDINFPDPSTSTKEGAVAIGGDLSIERLLRAYALGFFPWYNPDEPIIWWHPDPRFIIIPHEIRVTKSMRSYFSKEKFQLSFDQCFTDVVTACEEIKRRDQPGTWITDQIKDAYTALHDYGVAHSVEVWQDGDLVGGLYGVSLGKVFYGESMFSKVSNSSKFALIALASILDKQEFELIDCQMPNPHLKSMGGRFVGRERFIEILEHNQTEPTLMGDWNDQMNIYPIPDLIQGY